MIEPSDTERAELPECSAQYILDLEQRIAELEDALSDIASSGCVFLTKCSDVDIERDAWCPACKARQALLPEVGE